MEISSKANLINHQVYVTYGLCSLCKLETNHYLEVLKHTVIVPFLLIKNTLIFIFFLNVKLSLTDYYFYINILENFTSYFICFPFLIFFLLFSNLFVINILTLSWCFFLFYQEKLILTCALNLEHLKMHKHCRKV